MEEYEDENSISKFDAIAHRTDASQNKATTNDKSTKDDVHNLRNQFIAACNKGDLKLVQKLINQGYRDEDNLALSIAISTLNTKLISKLLALKVRFLVVHNTQDYLIILFE